MVLFNNIHVLFYNVLNTYCMKVNGLVRYSTGFLFFTLMFIMWQQSGHRNDDRVLTEKEKIELEKKANNLSENIGYVSKVLLFLVSAVLLVVVAVMFINNNLMVKNFFWLWLASLVPIVLLLFVKF